MSTIIIEDKYGDKIEVGTTTSISDITFYTNPSENEDVETLFVFGREALKPLIDLLTEDEPTDANIAKLALAVEHGLRAKFTYTSLSGETKERRLEPSNLSERAVSGESYDEDGAYEGYRQFRLDGIQGNVAIR